MMRGDSGLALVSEVVALLLLRLRGFTGFLTLLLVPGSGECSRLSSGVSADTEDTSLLVSVASVDIVMTVAADSDEQVRDKGGCVADVVADVSSTSSAAFSIYLPPGIPEKLKWELVPVGTGLINTGDMVFRKSRYA